MLTQFLLCVTPECCQSTQPWNSSIEDTPYCMLWNWSWLVKSNQIKWFLFTFQNTYVFMHTMNMKWNNKSIRKEEGGFKAFNIWRPDKNGHSPFKTKMFIWITKLPLSMMVKNNNSFYPKYVHIYLKQNVHLHKYNLVQ